MIYILHHLDHDGRCAGAIAFRSKVFKKTNEPIKCIEMDYKDADGYDFSAIQERDIICILDYSFKPEKMKQLQEKTKRIIWIDHHETAFGYDYGVVLEGIRSSEASGCELAWKYFCGNDKVPEAVRLIGDHDMWKYRYGDATRKFVEGLKIFPMSPTDKIWDDLFGKNTMTESILSIGSACIKYRDSFCQNYRNNYGYETTLEGLNCYAMNLFTLGSLAYGKLFDKYDAVIAYVHDGDRFTCSIYSLKHDVSIIAKKLGGGGHPKASGWVCAALPFVRNK